MKILVVEDEPGISRMLQRGLITQGYETAAADNGEDGLRLALEGDVDLVLLDIMLPGLDGRQVLRRIRARKPDLPVLMLTAKDEIRSKVSALDEGADDYLTKPFALEELLARVRVLSRRAEQPDSNVIEFGNLRVDLLAHRVWVSDKQVDLSSREFALLEYFLRHPGQVLSRQQILSAIWDYSFDPGSNVVDVYVRYLRKKIDRPGSPSVITTIRGAGYRLDRPEKDA
ncbi:Response regulators consisting of a CheY-like receiver domain and a winged-helix DNA-binding domain [Rubrobacter radiotolerans]|uniref:Response regulator transcription factor n=1 Tax=Rubrobacter radiotolerans TaxID=42256 RepID=A0A023X7G6_RUBRA|nr:response regulator transcription factor [Rubrobacter radiotolerans]AHY47980.1 Response regulators consisting of a CheY-like receiver domain and a winged-helix DNA-binding domain [Rubrobacter radiotolerans]MDX5892618.1 response regulator transcription factor [Rubrobacter radiotolerans]SMC07936.1 two component transcriptional regulator, winged helix family [Rubrobacter radiotolerans DSM 5868]